MAQQTNVVPAGILVGMSGLLLMLALPQVNAAWLTAPAGLDHTQAITLDAQQRTNYLTALNILPQSQTFYALADSSLRTPNMTSPQRESAIEMLQQAAALTPGNTHVWYLLAAALESQMYSGERREQWDHALSMSLLTGPFARDLTMNRALQITQHWDIASPDLKNLWQEQMINLWGADPNEMHRIYMTLPIASQQILVDTFGEVPEVEQND